LVILQYEEINTYLVSLFSESQSFCMTLSLTYWTYYFTAAVFLARNNLYTSCEYQKDNIFPPLGWPSLICICGCLISLSLLEAGGGSTLHSTALTPVAFFNFHLSSGQTEQHLALNFDRKRRTIKNMGVCFYFTKCTETGKWLGRTECCNYIEMINWWVTGCVVIETMTTKTYYNSKCFLRREKTCSSWFSICCRAKCERHYSKIIFVTCNSPQKTKCSVLPDIILCL